MLRPKHCTPKIRRNYNDAKHPNRVRCKEGKAPARKKTPSRLHCRRLQSAFIISENRNRKVIHTKRAAQGKDCSHRAAHFNTKIIQSQTPRHSATRNLKQVCTRTMRLRCRRQARSAPETGLCVAWTIAGKVMTDSVTVWKRSTETTE